MINVLHVVGKMNIGGIETLIMNYYKEIDRSKFNFDFVAVTPGKGAYDDEIARLGGSIYHPPAFRWFNTSPFCAWWEDFLTNNRVDIVHQHNYGASSSYFPIVKNKGVKTILHAHTDRYPESLRENIKRCLQKKAMNYADALLACSNEAGICYFDNKPFQIVNNAINVDRFDYSIKARQNVRSDLKWNDDNYVIGCVGRYTASKNHLFAIDVFAEVLKMNNKARLLLIGDGELKSSIDNKVHHMNLEKYVKMIPPRTDIEDYYSAMDCLLFPSLYEGLGMVAVEAQASGLPVVMSTNVPDAAVIKHVHKISLNQPASYWADICINAKISEHRSSGVNDVKIAGFDIKSNTRQLEQLYRSICEHNNERI